jgi:NAD(P)-dependent dehydrogenase (short-subunit alcohol dehydrogenase family)
MKIALITGAGSGIGAATALLAAERGYGVAVLDIDSSRAEQVAEQARRLGAASIALTADVADEAAVAGAFATCAERLGLPTAVLANAGIERNLPAHEMPLTDWQAVIDINLTGAFLTARAAIATLIAAEKPGSIVITSSPAATVGFAGGGNAACAASKGGISAAARSLAIDYASIGIRVNTIVPGATDTPLLVAHLPMAQRSEALALLRDEARQQIPIGRLAVPREIAETALWLWSPASSYVTGTHVTCDGGLTARSANTF